MPAKQWFYQDNQGSEIGPFTGSQLRELVRIGRVRRETPVRADAGVRLIAARQIQGLFPEWEPEAGPRREAVGAEGSRAPSRAGGFAEDQPFEEIDVHRSNPPQGSAPNNVLAIVSLISGVLGWSFVPIFGAIVAIITGHIALKQIERSHGREDGKIMAIIGLILGYIEAVLVLVAAITLLTFGIGLAGFIGLVFHHAERESQRIDRERPGIESPAEPSTIVPPFPSVSPAAPSTIVPPLPSVLGGFRETADAFDRMKGQDEDEDSDAEATRDEEVLVP